MPLYEYICDTCEQEFEMRRSFRDEGMPPCPSCNGTGRVRKKLSLPAIVFKGSGFYVTDARGKNSAALTKSSKDTSSGSESETTTSSESKADSSAAKAKDD